MLTAKEMISAAFQGNEMLFFIIGASLFLIIVARVALSDAFRAQGEDLVAKRLLRLPNEVYKVIHNVMLPTIDGITTQIDHVVISRFGIFVIETKDYSGWIFGKDTARTWTQKFPNGESFQFQNPIRQNWRHIYTLADALEIPRRLFVNVVAFCGSAELMSDEIPEGVMYSKSLCKYIRSFNDPIMSDAQVERIIDKIANIDKSITEEQRLSHVYNLKAHHDPVQLSVACEMGELKCPKCGSKMVLRHRKSDGHPFYGCTKYPACKGVVDAE